jgi:hypothetical protein
MRTRNILGVKVAGAWGWRPHHLQVLNVMKIWEPKIPGTLWATLGLLWDSFIFTSFILRILCFRIIFVLFCVLFFLLCCLFPIYVQVYWPLSLGGNQTVVNKYQISNDKQINKPKEHGRMITGKLMSLHREKPILVPLCPPQIPHGLLWASAVRSQCITDWAMTWWMCNGSSVTTIIRHSNDILPTITIILHF